MKRCILCLAVVAACFAVGSSSADEERFTTSDGSVEIAIEVKSTSDVALIEPAVSKLTKPKGPPPHADGDRNYGRIKRLYPAGDGRFFFSGHFPFGFRLERIQARNVSYSNNLRPLRA